MAFVLGVYLNRTTSGVLVSIENDTIDLGEVGDKQNARAQLVLLNRGNESVDIRQVRTSCGCVVVYGKVSETKTPSTLLAHSKCEIPLRIHTQGRVGPQNTQIAVFLENGESLSASVLWKVTPTAFAVPPVLSFEARHPDEVVEAPFQIVTPDLSKPFVLDRIESSSEFIRTERITIQNEDGASINSDQKRVVVQLTLPPSAFFTNDRIDAQVTVFSKDEAVGPIVVPVHCRIRAPLVVVPRAPVMLVDQDKKSASIILLCRLAPELEDERLSISSDSSSVEVIEQPANTSRERRLAIRCALLPKDMPLRTSIHVRAGQYVVNCPVIVSYRNALTSPIR